MVINIQRKQPIGNVNYNKGIKLDLERKYFEKLNKFKENMNS